MNKGSTQHKIFKAVILIIVAIFGYLIYSFIKIEFFGMLKSKKYMNFETFNEKYEYLFNKDKKFKYTNSELNEVEECKLDTFYSNYVSPSKPCIIKFSKENRKLVKDIQNELSVIETSQETEKLKKEEKYLLKNLLLDNKNYKMFNEILKYLSLEIVTNV